jgi:hypothetical protein
VSWGKFLTDPDDATIKRAQEVSARMLKSMPQGARAAAKAHLDANPAVASEIQDIRRPGHRARSRTPIEPSDPPVKSVDPAGRRRGLSTPFGYVCR